MLSNTARHATYVPDDRRRVAGPDPRDAGQPARRVPTQLHEAAFCGRRELLRKTLQQVADPELRKQLEKLVAKFDYAPFLELLS